jgi:hypothetical protein
MDIIDPDILTAQIVEDLELVSALPAAERKKKVLLGNAGGEIQGRGGAVRLDVFQHSLEQSPGILENLIHPRKDTLGVKFYFSVFLRRRGSVQGKHQGDDTNACKNFFHLISMMKEKFSDLSFCILIISFLAIKTGRKTFFI